MKIITLILAALFLGIPICGYAKTQQREVAIRGDMLIVGLSAYRMGNLSTIEIDYRGKLLTFTTSREAFHIDLGQDYPVEMEKELADCLTGAGRWVAVDPYRKADRQLYLNVDKIDYIEMRVVVATNKYHIESGQVVEIGSAYTKQKINHLLSID